MKQLSLSHQDLRVLQDFLNARGEELSGSDWLHPLKLSAGTLYPILIRFERYGLLESRWEELEPSAMGGPRRRLYRLTASGEDIARQQFVKSPDSGRSRI